MTTATETRPFSLNGYPALARAIAGNDDAREELAWAVTRWRQGDGNCRVHIPHLVSVTDGNECATADLMRLCAAALDGAL